MENENYKNDGRLFTGLFLIAAGCIIIAFKLGAPIPAWLITWPVALIAIGIGISIKHRFRSVPGLILILIGGINLFDQLTPESHIRNYTFPVIIIAVGLFFIFRPKKQWKHRRDYDASRDQWTSIPESDTYKAMYEGADYIDATCVLGGTKRIIVSKNFRGGDITCFMGGAEIDLTQADIQSPAVLDVTMVFGGCKLIVPANWEVKSEVSVVFGGIDDKRVLNASNITPGKVLVLEGTAVFGGIEIRSY